jgi:enamine deaminase RidA (YjgF/YER057c/UK114 family)
VTLTLANAPACAPSVARTVGELVFVGGSGPAADAPLAAPAGDVRGQAGAAFDALEELLEMAGGGLGDVIDLVSLHADARTIEAVFEVGRERFGGDFPAWTPVAVTALPVPGTLVTVSAVAHLGDAPRRCVVPDTIMWWHDLPASAGCRKGDLLFVAGMYGSDADGNVNTPGDHAGQARNALNRVKEVCELSGASLDDVIAVTSFHQDPRWIPSVAAVYEQEFFGAAGGPAATASSRGPAWSAVGVPGLLRLGMLGQYRAVVDAGPATTRAVVDPGSATPPAAGTGARPALAAGTGAPPAADGGDVVHRGDPEAQARAAFAALAESLAGSGMSLADVVQLTSFHIDAEAFEAAARVGRELLGGGDPPAWTAAGMTGTWEEGQEHALHALAAREDAAR